MSGPQIGSLAYNEAGGHLHVKIEIEFVRPTTTYEVFLVGGPAHNVATGYMAIGKLLTNAVGAGAGAFTVAHATLLAGPFGGGCRTDHIDMLRAAGDLSHGALTAGAINYFVCREKEQPGHEAFKLEAYKGATGEGDPHGPSVKK